MCVAGQKLTLKLGFSHDTVFEVPDSMRAFLPDPTTVGLYGIDKEQVSPVETQHELRNRLADVLSCGAGDADSCSHQGTAAAICIQGCAAGLPVARVEPAQCLTWRAWLAGKGIRGVDEVVKLKAGKRK